MSKISDRKWTGSDGKERKAYVVRYLHEGKHRSKQFERRKDAEAFRIKVDHEKATGTHIAATDGQTVAYACEAYLRRQEDRQRQGAVGRGRITNIKKAIDISIVPLLGHRKMHDLKSAEIEAWFHTLVREKNLAPTTARGRLEILSGLYRFAVKQGWARSNVASDSIVDIGAIKRARVATFTTEQIGMVLKAVQDRPPRFRERSFHTTRCAIHLAAFCGLRLGEILALKRKHVRFDLGVIEVRHSLDGWRDIKGPKSDAGVRDVPMPSHLADMLSECVRVCYIEDERDLIFTSMRGEPLATSSFRYEIWYPVLARAGLHNAKGGKQFHFHALRHFAASYMISNSIALPDVAEMLGHASFDLTLRVYSHAISTPGYRAQAFEAMSRKLLAPPPAIEGEVAN